jgi:hypothetical protein
MSRAHRASRFTRSASRYDHRSRALSSARPLFDRRLPARFVSIQLPRALRRAFAAPCRRSRCCRAPPSAYAWLETSRSGRLPPAPVGRRAFRRRWRKLWQPARDVALAHPEARRAACAARSRLLRGSVSLNASARSSADEAEQRHAAALQDSRQRSSWRWSVDRRGLPGHGCAS